MAENSSELLRLVRILQNSQQFPRIPENSWELLRIPKMHAIRIPENSQRIPENSWELIRIQENFMGIPEIPSVFEILRIPVKTRESRWIPEHSRGFLRIYEKILKSWEFLTNDEISREFKGFVEISLKLLNFRENSQEIPRTPCNSRDFFRIPGNPDNSWVRMSFPEISLEILINADNSRIRENS
jgi:hypothetical protein